MTETKITEFIVGVISAYMFLWLFPIAASIQRTVSTYYSANAMNAPVIVSAGALIFCIGLFGLVAIYCLGSCLEKLAFWLIKLKQVKQ